MVLPDFSSDWFANFPIELNHDPKGFEPTPAAPFLGLGTFLPDAPFDRNGTVRQGKVDLGPFELP